MAAAWLFPYSQGARTAGVLLGALCAAFFVYAVAHRAQGSRLTIVLAGVAISTLMSAGIDAIVTIRPEALTDRAAFTIGGFASVSTDALLMALPYMAAGLAGAFLLAPRLNLLLLGDETAASLGVAVRACRFLSIFGAAALAAGAVSVCGLLGFVGLMVPHMLRRVTLDIRGLVPLCALGGSALVLLCDILARVLFVPMSCLWASSCRDWAGPFSSSNRYTYSPSRLRRLWGADKLHDLSFAIPDHGFVALIGPNGCASPRSSGYCRSAAPSEEKWITTAFLSSMPRNLRARRISFLPQTRNIPDIPARTLIEYGRYPHLGFSKRLSPGDDAAVERAIALSGVSFLLDRPVSSLSGGERQRVYLAMLLAQDCETLLLDEPTTFLDIHAQLEVLEAIRAMRTGGKTIVAALHDLPQASPTPKRYAYSGTGGCSTPDVPRILPQPAP